MIQVEEQGRRLRIVVGGEEEFIIPPNDSRAGAALLIGFLGMLSDVWGDMPANTQESATTDIVLISLGGPVLKDADHPTESEMARKAAAAALFERVEELRAHEIYEVTQAAFFWQTQGGILAAKTFAQGGVDAYPKALGILAESSGLEIIARTISTGNSSESETGPTGLPDTNTPAPSETLSKLPLEKRSVRQNQN